MDDSLAAMRIALPACDVDKRRRHFSPVAEFQGAFAQTAASDDGDGIGRAAVDFDKGEQTLAIFPVRVFNSKLVETEHRHANTEHLSGTQVSVSQFGVAQVFVEGLHALLGYREPR